MLTNIIYEAMNFAIIFVCVLGAYGIFRSIKKRCYPATTPVWLLWLLGIMFVYFALFYVYVILVPDNIAAANSLWVGRTLVRPANVIFFAVVSAFVYFHSCARKK